MSTSSDSKQPDESDNFANRLRDAEAGDLDAQFRLAQGFLWGEGDLPLDRKKAIYWLRKSAKGGNPEAMFRLGWCLYYGAGTEEDQEEAARWFRQAAEASHPEAMDMLGRCLLYGKGVPKDRREAARWFRLEAEKGDHLFASVDRCPLCGKMLYEKPLCPDHGLFSCSECNVCFPRRSTEAIPQTPQPPDSKIVVKRSENELILELPPKGAWAGRSKTFLWSMFVLGNLAWPAIPVSFFLFGPKLIRLLPESLAPLAFILGIIAGFMLLCQTILFFVERWSQKRYRITPDRFSETEAFILLRNTETKKRNELIGVRADGKIVYLDGVPFVSRIEVDDNDEARRLAYEIDRFYREHPGDGKEPPGIMDRLIQAETPTFSAECPSCGERYRFDGESFRCSEQLRCRNCLQLFPCLGDFVRKPRSKPVLQVNRCRIRVQPPQRLGDFARKPRSKPVLQVNRCRIRVQPPQRLRIRSRLNWNVGRLLSGFVLVVMFLYATGLVLGLCVWPITLLKEVGIFSLPVTQLHPGVLAAFAVILLCVPVALLFLVMFWTVIRSSYADTFFSWEISITEKEIVYSFGAFRKTVRRLPIVAGLHAVPRNDHRRFTVDRKNPAIDQEFAVVLRVDELYFAELPCYNTAEVDRIFHLIENFLAGKRNGELSEEDRAALPPDPEIASPLAF